MPSFDRAGCPLYYEVDGEGPAIVFAHGAGGNHLSWWQQVPEFRDSYRCVALDQRGFGRSLVEPGGEDPSPEAFRLDLVALLDELAIEKSALVAQSMGGWGCLGVALSDPQRVAALVMADTLGGVTNDLIAEARAPGREQVREGGLLGRAVAARLAVDRPDLAFLYGQIAGLNRPLDQILTSGLGNERTPDDLRGLTVPTLWIVGSEDPLMPPVAMREAHRLTLRSEYFEVAETGHSVYFERAPQFNTRVRKFLSDQGWG
jgi:3-oxoadipate enol-lactonase